ncbi:unnamed protein product [marine sediment metagenome]|uniref:Uncharacterized protein n=1 Tax=marine sediment metagenome TaxID=412755 RepID=X1Q3M2_9ZZZZ
MKFRWGKEKIKGFSNPIKKAERTNDWAWWTLFGTVIIMEILVILKMSGKI